MLKHMLRNRMRSKFEEMSLHKTSNFVSLNMDSDDNTLSMPKLEEFHFKEVRDTQEDRDSGSNAKDSEPKESYEVFDKRDLTH